MSSIRILPDEIANRIAAGEVIERPASVVKELLENALDAGARRVVVQATQGGRRLIQVTDDGCGMDRDDAMLCLEAHATSKIHTAADIENITTLGFRGEALPSIAAVSRFRLQTRPADAPDGVELLVENGALRDVRSCGCAAGTQVRVEHLFSGLPARRKFLQQPATEKAHIQETVLLQALAHPDTAFELRLDAHEALHATAATGLDARVAMLLGTDLFRDMLPVEYEEAGIRVRGFIARPGLTRSSRREQRLFVNGRPAAADPLYFGIRDAYHTLVMKGRYPPVVLFVDLACDRIDVNVHPAKRTVRFREARLVGQVTAAAVRRALRQLAGELGTPPAAAGGPISLRKAAVALTLTSAPLQQPLPWQGRADTTPAATTAPGPTTASAEPACRGINPAAAPAPVFSGPGPQASAATRPEIRSLRVLGTLKDLYLVAEGQSGLVLIDQHAAHERILFERLLEEVANSPRPRQALLLPVTLDLAPDDAALLKRVRATLEQLGFCLEPFSGRTFIVTAVPARLKQENIAGLIRDILDELRESPGAQAHPDEVRVAQAACKHAVKANDPLDGSEIRQLLADLAATQMPYTCPHGRPVMINVPFRDLEKRFGRQA